MPDTPANCDVAHPQRRGYQPKLFEKADGKGSERGFGAEAEIELANSF